MGVVTVEFCDNLDSSPSLAVADYLLAVSCWEEALAVVLDLHRVVRDVCVPLGTSHLKTWMFRLKIYIIGANCFTCAAQITHNCLELRDGLLVTVFVEDEGHTVECSRRGHWDLKRWADLLLSAVVRGVWGVPWWLNIY